MKRLVTDHNHCSGDGSWRRRRRRRIGENNSALRGNQGFGDKAQLASSSYSYCC
jgi:hypothetical protein